MPTETPGLIGDALKAQIMAPNGERVKDALMGVEPSPYGLFADRATVGPYTLEQLYSSEVTQLLADPSRILIVTCGRNENGRGNLGPTFEYLLESTKQAGNILYVDGDSSDGSAELANSLGITNIQRREMLQALDVVKLVEILNMPAESFTTEEQITGYPPLRKGIDVMAARMEMLRRATEGKLPPHVIFVDTDIKSHPKGTIIEKLTPEQIYHPLQLVAAGLLELNSRRENEIPELAIYTGSGGRNNEPVAAAYNMITAQAKSPFLTEEQREIARAYFAFPGVVLHPLTGDLAVYTGAEYGKPLELALENQLGTELNAMNATGQCIETARLITLASAQLEAYGSGDPDNLDLYLPLVGNARRGRQERMDEPQPDHKEWWMITTIIPIFIAVVTQYSIEYAKPIEELTLEDYRKINDWLSRIKHGSRIDKHSQQRDWDLFPMERAIPPVTLLAKEGILKW